jgi:hypothetical protein
VEEGERFRKAYREVAAALQRGETFPSPSTGVLIARRRSTGGIGNPGIGTLAARSRALHRWETGHRGRYLRALRRLEGRRR